MTHSRLYCVFVTALVALTLGVAAASAQSETTAPPPQKSELAITNAAPADPNSPPQTPQEAQITSVSGASVQYTIDEGKTWEKADNGVKLPANAAVRTGFGSRCEISFKGTTVLIVQPLSSVKIEKYLGAVTTQTINANLQYGAVRAGVEEGRIKSDTRISTPVSTLSIRGTIVYVEYDRGTRRCQLKVVEDGPALASARNGDYLLDEMMETDCSLGRYLRQAIFDHHVWVTGDVRLGYDSEGINESLAHYGNTPTFEEGGQSFNDPRAIVEQQPSSEFIYEGDDIPIGDLPVN